MDSEKGLTVNGAPRKRRLKGFDPLIAGRAPAPIVERIRAKAKARKVSVSAVLREALDSYLRNNDDRNRAA
jgi:hypothetical protein